MRIKHKWELLLVFLLFIGYNMGLGILDFYHAISGILTLFLFWSGIVITIIWMLLRDYFQEAKE